MYELTDLLLLLKSSQPLINIQTREEVRALEMMQRCGERLGRQVLQWSVTRGLVTAKTGKPNLFLAEDDGPLAARANQDATEVLREIQRSRRAAIYVLIDFHPWIVDPVVVRLIKEIALDQPKNSDHIVFLGQGLQLPAELSRFTALFTITLPDRTTLRKLILREARQWRSRNASRRLRMDRDAVDLLASNLTGLTVAESSRLIRNAIYDDDAILQSDIERVQKAKYELLGQNGLLQFEYETAKFEQVGGLSRLKDWLRIRRDAFLSVAPVEGLDKPKGMLLVGVQGSGKSLAARAVAGVWGVPLLRLDFGTLYNKFFGETEKNIREALEQAEVMSPCVLWIDEIEKGVATGDYDSGTSQRLLATLLTWMAERKSAVFIVATANRIEALPPELVRKGRLDEVFFVDLPDVEVRREIFSIHLGKRGLDASNYDTGLLAEKSEGFSGAEIEQVVVSARYQAYSMRTAVTMDMLLAQIDQTSPLSVVMAEAVDRLRAWAQGRTVMAN